MIDAQNNSMGCQYFIEHATALKSNNKRYKKELEEIIQLLTPSEDNKIKSIDS